MSERYEPVDPRHEDALARALHEHAESVRPAGDGLVRIRARVERRRAHRRFLVPTAGLAIGAAAAAVVVGSGVLAGSNHPATTALGEAGSSSPATPTQPVIPPQRKATPADRPTPAVTTTLATAVPMVSAAPASTAAPATTPVSTPDTAAPSSGLGAALTNGGLRPALNDGGDQPTSSAATSAGPPSTAESASSTTATGVKLPTNDFVAVTQDSVLGLYDAAGRLVRTLGTVAQPGLAISGGTVYFSGPVASAHGGCGSYRLDLGLIAGGAGAYLPSEQGNQALPATAGDTLAWLGTTCSGDGSNVQMAIRWRNGAQGAAGSITGFTSPPVPETLALSPDGKQLVSFIRTGMQGELVTFDLATAQTLADGKPVPGCSDSAALCIAGAYESNGDLVHVTTDGQQFTVYRDHAGATTKLFAVSASGTRATLSVNASGAVLLTDGTSKGWSWQPGTTAAKPLPFSVTDAAW